MHIYLRDKRGFVGNENLEVTFFDSCLLLYALQDFVDIALRSMRLYVLKNTRQSLDQVVSEVRQTQSVCV